MLTVAAWLIPLGHVNFFILMGVTLKPLTAACFLSLCHARFQIDQVQMWHGELMMWREWCDIYLHLWQERASWLQLLYSCLQSQTHFSHLPPGQTLPAGGWAELRQRPTAERNLSHHHLRQDLWQECQEVTVGVGHIPQTSILFPNVSVLLWPEDILKSAFI